MNPCFEVKGVVSYTPRKLSPITSFFFALKHIPSWIDQTDNVPRHGTITGFKVYRGLESHGLKITKKIHYTVPAVCAVFLRVVKDGKCRTPSVVCSEVRTSHTAPPPPAGARPRLRAVSESHLCVWWWWPKEVNPWNFFPCRKTRSLPYGNFSGNAD